MNKHFIKPLVVICLLFSTQFVSFAQMTIGYVNSVALLSELPEVKAADSQLEALQKQLQKQGQTMVESFQVKYQELAKKEQNGELSPKQSEEEGQKLKDEEAKIVAFEQEMTAKIQEKREALYKPILDKINAAINLVSVEKGLKYVFDSTTGIILYSDESNDITPLVKAKLSL